MEKKKGNLLNLLYLLTLPSTPKTYSYVHSFDSVEELKDKSPEFKEMFTSKKFSGHYLNLILRGYDSRDNLVQISVIQTGDGNFLDYFVSCAEEELNNKAAENGLNPEECTLAAKGIFSRPKKEVYLSDLLKGKYMDVKTHSEKLYPALNSSF